MAKVRFKNSLITIFLFYYSYFCIAQNVIEKKYKEAKIGNQIWMAENLNVSKFRNGDVIPEAKTNEEWIRAGKEKQPAWCYYNNDVNNGNKFGKLYNAYAVNDTRGIAPEGWHVATNVEWKRLESDLYKLGPIVGDKYSQSEEFVGLKIKSKDQWINNTGGNNNLGFNAYPAGYRLISDIPKEPSDFISDQEYLRNVNHQKNANPYGQRTNTNSKQGDFLDLGKLTFFWTTTIYDNIDEKRNIYSNISRAKEQIQHDEKTIKESLLIWKQEPSPRLKKEVEELKSFIESENNKLTKIPIEYSTAYLTATIVDFDVNDPRGHKYIHFTHSNPGLGYSVRCVKSLNGHIVKLLDGIKIQCNYIDDKLNGGYKECYLNGNTKIEGNYLNDRSEGFFHEFDTLGREIGLFHYKSGSLWGKCKVFFDSIGKPVTNRDYATYFREIYYLNNEIDTNYLVTHYYLNGIKKYETKLLSDAPEIPNGMTKFYDTFGNLSSEGLFISGKKVGIWKEYHPNGMPKKQYFMITEYKLYKTENQRTYSEIIKANVINGYVFYYDETGTILKSEYFRHGDIEKEFDHDKSIKLEKKYKDDPNQSRLSLF
jgi:uncharacterized protein (TIGR02145 family)